ncbi:unnamed protein product [Brugia pahangi]|uniref:Uncharacterized protein n=1 Tax=Brugia pahangi TaxID=6280 RepID=A0A0N4TZ27_BRUPA|nr:unnamed protein product [Brugia pahangi]
MTELEIINAVKYFRALSLIPYDKIQDDRPDHVHPKSGMQKDTERRPDSDRCCYFNSFQNQFDSKFYRRNLGDDPKHYML